MDFAADIESNLREIDKEIVRENEQMRHTHEKRIEIKKKFCEILQFHGDAVQLSSIFSRI